MSYSAELTSGNAALEITKENGISLKINGETRFQRSRPAEAEWIDGRGDSTWTKNKYYEIQSDSDSKVRCKGIADSPNGSRLIFTDIFESRNKDNCFYLERNVDVLAIKGDDKGFSTRFGLKTALQHSILDFNYLSPGILYKQNKQAPDGAIASYPKLQTDDDFFFFTTHCPLGPFIMMQHIGDEYRLTLAQEDAEPSSSFSGDDFRPRIIDEKLQYGALGIRKEPKPLIGFVFPGTEQDRTYVGGGGKRTLRSHPLKQGITHNYNLILKAGSSPDFNRAAENTIDYFWEVYNPSNNILSVDMKKAYEANISLIYDLCEPRGPENIRGIPWGDIDIISGELKNPSYQMGWIGAQIEGAYHLIRYGHEHSSETHKTYGVDMIDFWANRSWPDYNELPYKWYAGGWGSHWSQEGDLRHYGDGFFVIMKSYSFEKNRGAEHSNWIEYCKDFGDWLHENQNSDGSWYNKYDVVDGSNKTANKSRSCFVIPFLIRLYNETRNQVYLDTALRAGNFAFNNSHLHCSYTGGAIDNGNVTDKESVLITMRAFTSLYNVTDNSKWLEAAEQAAKFGITWTYTWNIEIPENNYSKLNLFYEMEYYTSGQGLVALGHSYCDFYAAEHAGDYYQLYKLTNDEKYKIQSELLINNSMQLVDYESSIAFNKTFHEGAAPEGLAGTAMGGYRGNTNNAWLGFCTMGRLTGITDLQDLSEDPNSLSSIIQWKFDDDAKDSSGNSNHGVLHPAEAGSISFVQEGNDGCVEFDNPKDRIVSPLINLGTVFTVAGWIKIDANFTGSWNRFLVTNNINSGFGLFQDLSSMKWKFTVNGDWSLPLAGTMQPGEWQYVAGTFDGQNAKLYLNGELVSGPALLTPPSETDHKIVLGKDSNDWETSFTGRFDECVIYKRALNQQEIRNIYNHQKNPCVFPPEYDLDGDCFVGTSDFFIMASEWLECGRMGTCN
ncbi:LamG domain-containing protein [Sedimentisphaera cyanobacteriorum]|uniref:LamG domain-containing protein n=1 Tax=Sedimentisphaera cyanobacteriorum TaxID=1940790 RepID=UPI00137352D1|nr:LamG domain-containing protein [Sedimentisphaera cyanobacteriorum]